VDRESDVLNSGGKRVSATEIESTLDAHPAVGEVAVFGLPHPVMGQLLAAALVLDKGTTVPEVRAFARERLAPHKVPVRWMTTSTLPRNRMGKGTRRMRHGRGSPGFAHRRQDTLSASLHGIC